MNTSLASIMETVVGYRSLNEKGSVPATWSFDENHSISRSSLVKEADPCNEIPRDSCGTLTSSFSFTRVMKS